MPCGRGDLGGPTAGHAAFGSCRAQRTGVAGRFASLDGGRASPSRHPRSSSPCSRLAAVAAGGAAAGAVARRHVRADGPVDAERPGRARRDHGPRPGWHDDARAAALERHAHRSRDADGARAAALRHARPTPASTATSSTSRPGLPSGALIQQGQLAQPPEQRRARRAGITVRRDARRAPRDRDAAPGPGRGAAHPFVGSTASRTRTAPRSSPRLGTVDADGGRLGCGRPVPLSRRDARARRSARRCSRSSPVPRPSPIPPGGAVLVGARQRRRRSCRPRLPSGTTVKTRLILDADVAGSSSPRSAAARRSSATAPPVFRAGEEFIAEPARSARAANRASASSQDGRILLVTVDGRQPGWSVGMTNFELAQALVRLGAVTGMALDGGGSTTMAFDGTLLNRPAGGAERPISTRSRSPTPASSSAPPLPAVSPERRRRRRSQSARLQARPPVVGDRDAHGARRRRRRSPRRSTQPAPGTYPRGVPAGAPTRRAASRASGSSGRHGDRRSRPADVDERSRSRSTTRSASSRPRCRGCSCRRGGRDLTISLEADPPGARRGHGRDEGGRRRPDPRRAQVTTPATARSSGTASTGSKKRVKGGVYRRARRRQERARRRCSSCATFTVRQIAGRPPPGPRRGSPCQAHVKSRDADRLDHRLAHPLDRRRGPLRGVRPDVRRRRLPGRERGRDGLRRRGRRRGLRRATA